MMILLRLIQQTLGNSFVLGFLFSKNTVCLDLKNPEIVTLRNLSRESAGVYKCTASNDVGEESCTVEVKIHCKCLCASLQPCDFHQHTHTHIHKCILYITNA